MWERLQGGEQEGFSRFKKCLFIVKQFSCNSRYRRVEEEEDLEATNFEVREEEEEEEEEATGALAASSAGQTRKTINLRFALARISQKKTPPSLYPLLRLENVLSLSLDPVPFSLSLSNLNSWENI